MKIIGIIPARMAASRFPGKPLFNIIDRPMLSHVWGRAKLFDKWDHLSIATCDNEIASVAEENNYKYIMTGTHHTRALDRVAEAAGKIDEFDLEDDDIIINVQGDEPMLHPEMFDALIDPMIKNQDIKGTILGMLIEEEEIWRNPDTVKLIHNDNWEVLYTSRAAIPYNNNKFSKELGARRIYGLFAFRWKYLKQFSAHPETRLEKLESCDSNRTLDMDFRQYVAPYPFVRSYSVDNMSDIKIVESYIREDKYWNKY
jgi:3-deoxy-manno-octulosonate cytidylyltransferase (CMP-KDO synthetase)